MEHQTVKKIMFHINSLGKGGAERVVVNLSGEFIKNGREVIIATEWTAKDEYPVDEKVRRENVGLTEAEEKLSGAAKRKLRTKRLRELLKKEQPDVLLSFCRNANYRAVLAAGGTAWCLIDLKQNCAQLPWELTAALHQDILVFHETCRRSVLP